MDPVILASARKHGVADEDTLHAYRHPIRVFELDDLTMLVGADAAGRLGDRYGRRGRVRAHRPRLASPSEVLEVTAMPRSIQDILDHADELARRFEDYEPSPDDEVAVAEHLLRRAALARARSERQIGEAVDAARRAGISWKRIGAELGITAQAAQQRYGPATRSGPPGDHC